MLIRIWKVNLAPGKGSELETFAREYSLPMLKNQPGCLAVIFSRTESECVTVTLWDYEQSIEQLNQSESYQSVFRRIEQSGILGDNHSTEVLSVYGGFTPADLPGQWE